MFLFLGFEQGIRENKHGTAAQNAMDTGKFAETVKLTTAAPSLQTRKSIRQ